MKKNTRSFAIPSRAHMLSTTLAIVMGVGCGVSPARAQSVTVDPHEPAFMAENDKLSSPT